MRTVEDILADMSALMEASANRSMTDEEVTRYEAFEADLVKAKRDGVIRARHAAYNAPVDAPRTGPAPADKGDSLEKAFENYLRTGQPNADIAGLRVANAQGEGSGAAGGYLVPPTFRQRLIDRMKAFGGLANVVDEFNTADGRPVEWPTLDDTGNMGEVVDEGGSFSTGADLGFGSATLGAYRYMAGGGSSLPLRVSVELLQDSAFDVQKLVSDKLALRIARIQAPHLVKGTGVKQPQGITTGIAPVKAAVNTKITYEDLVTWTHSVDPAYRELGNCRWAFNDASLATIKVIKDTNNNFVFRPADSDLSTPTGGGTILGYPVTIDQGFVDYSAADSTKVFGVFGDLREGYVVRRVQEVVVVVNPWTRASNGEIEFSAWARMDAVQQNTAAYIGLSGQS